MIKLSSHGVMPDCKLLGQCAVNENIFDIYRLSHVCKAPHQTLTLGQCRDLRGHLRTHRQQLYGQAAIIFNRQLYSQILSSSQAKRRKLVESHLIKPNHLIETRIYLPVGMNYQVSVSYTHLTLPTIYSV